MQKRKVEKEDNLLSNSKMTVPEGAHENKEIENKRAAVPTNEFQWLTYDQKLKLLKETLFFKEAMDA